MPGSADLMAFVGLSVDRPDGQVPRGTIIVLGGRGESAELYRTFATQLAAAGFAVTVFGDITGDLPSARSGIAMILSDNRFTAPKVLVGSDTGALLALRLGIHAELGINGIVIAGAPVGAGPSSRRLALVGAEPQDGQEVPESLRVVDPQHVQAPVLALHGRDDSVAPMDSALEIYRAIPHSEIVMIDTSRHQILDGVTHRTAAATIVAFLERLESSTLESR